MQSERRKQSFELLFISFIGIVVLGAFVSSLNYDFVSARTPLCIMVPLIVLIGVQFNRARKAARDSTLRAELSPVMRGHVPEFNTVLALIGWMALFLVLIYGAGHYAGMVVFLFVLMRTVGNESLRLSTGVTVGVTAMIYLLFEYVFRIELYRGLIYDRLIANVI